MDITYRRDVSSLVYESFVLTAVFIGDGSIVRGELSGRKRQKNMKSTDGKVRKRKPTAKPGVEAQRLPSSPTRAASWIWPVATS